MASYVPNARQQFLDLNGNPLAAGSVGMYVVSTLTPKNTWQDSGETTLNSNPVPLDAGGYATIYGNGQYRQIVKDALGNTIYDRVVSPVGTINASLDVPPFTNSAFNSSVQYDVNGATPGTFYSSQQGGNNATEALTAAIIVPASATNHQTNALAGYIRADRAQPGNGGDVAAYHQAVSNANNAAVFPLNTVAADTAGKTGQTLSIELDNVVNCADTIVNGINVTISGNTTLTGSRNGVSVRGAFAPTSTWSNGFVTADGAIDIGGYAAFIGAVSSTTLTNRNSQSLGLVSYKSDNTRYIATIFGDSGGGIAIRPGSATGSIAFQDPTGAMNWASVSVNGLGYPTGTGAAVTQLTSKSTAPPAINKVCGQVTMNNAALAAGAVVSFTLTNSCIAPDDYLDVWVKSGNATAGTYRCWSEGNGNGSRVINLQNISAGSLSEAVVLGFGVNKRVIA